MSLLLLLLLYCYRVATVLRGCAARSDHASRLFTGMWTPRTHSRPNTKHAVDLERNSSSSTPASFCSPWCGLLFFAREPFRYSKSGLMKTMIVLSPTRLVRLVENRFQIRRLQIRLCAPVPGEGRGALHACVRENTNMNAPRQTTLAAHK